MQPTKRARTDQAKAQRRDTIVAVAQCLLRQHGLGDVTMAQICDGAGLSKPAVYNYFKTKEEIVLSVYETLLTQWMDGVMDGLANRQTPADRAAFNRLFAQGFTRDPLLPMLTNHLTATLEQNIPQPVFETFKEATADRIDALAGVLETHRFCPAGAGRSLALSYLTVLVGYAQLSVRSPHSLDGLSPRARAMIEDSGSPDACIAALDALR